MRINFFTQLVILVLVLTIAATGVTGFVLLRGMEASLKADVQREVQGQVTGLAHDIELMLQDKMRIGQVLTGHPQVIRGEAAGIADMLTAVERADSESYEAVNVTNKDGIVTHFAPADKSTKMIGMSIADRPYFKQARQTGKPVISDAMISRDTGKPIMIIASPIKDGSGNFTGLICQVIKLDAIDKLRAKIKIGETGYAGISTNSNGKAAIIAHPNETFVKEQKDVSDIAIIQATMTSGQKQLMSFRNVNGTDVIGATDIVPSTNWIITAMVPESEIYTEVTASRYKMLGIMAIAILAVILLTWYFARRISGRLTAMVKRVTQVADGDLRLAETAGHATDEIGQLGASLAAMTQSMRAVLQQVSHSAEQVAASSEELTASAEQSSQGASQVAASITEVAAGTERQTGAIRQTTAIVERISLEITQAATNVKTVEATSDKATNSARDGGKTVEAAIKQMSQIETKVTHSAQVVVKLGERSKEIGQIVDTISGIAGQTNLLALNAAIEAARAGEQGRGFAVVAEEVRKLAEQSQLAAKQISDMITEIRSDTDSAVLAMNQGTQEVKLGTDVVNGAGQAFGQIVSLVDQVSAEVSSISAAIQDIAGGSQEIVAALREIDVISKETAGQTQTVSAVTQEQSASMEEIAASSEALSKLAQNLQAVLQRFRL
jgi:methyl-accepting chemotaxis protein